MLSLYKVREHWKKRKLELMEEMAKGQPNERYWEYVGRVKAIGEFDNFLNEWEKQLNNA